MNSFRIKIALWSGLISGALLVGAGWLLWKQTARASLDQVDQELLLIGHSNLERRHGHTRYVELDKALNVFSSTNAGYILHFAGSGRSQHTSTNWPGLLAMESFAELTDYPPGVEVDPSLFDDLRGSRGSREAKSRIRLPLKIPRFETRSAEGRTWRMATMGNPTQTLILGVDIARFEDGLKRLRTVYLAVIPAGLLLVGFGAWFVAGRTLRPLNAVTASVENVTAKGLDQRIDIGAHDREFSRLISVFNEMLNRLQTSFQQATRFSADASHELKTPLAIMQGEIEQALRQAEDGSEIQRTFGRQLEEIQRLKIITRKLLLLSRADSGELVVSFERINLSEMIAATAEDADILASHLDVEAEIEPDILVDADPVLIQQVLQNLAANAANYNHDQGWIRMTLKIQGERALFRISNSGPGIAPEQRERVFDRFHRADTARNRDTDGVGLGLSLCREIVRAHDGELRLVDSSSETAVFELSLCLRRCRKKDAGDATSRSPQAAT